MTLERSTRSVICLPDTHRVRRYHVDKVGNTLNANLVWCETHHEPVWHYDDGSYECPYDLITQANHVHELTTPPWEIELPTIGEVT